MSEPNFTNPLVRWVDQRLPVFTMMHHSGAGYPAPRNLNYWWNYGSLAMLVLGIMLATGIVLAMHYVANADLAFASVERIDRDVNYGWLIRDLHMNGASMFFLVVYIHVFRGMYYGSYKSPREILWIIGVVIVLTMMGTAFLGYVLPWGQMSFWGATVITSFVSAVPLVGEPMVQWLWGGFAVGQPTLNRFFSLHYLLPFVIAGLVGAHVWALHIVKSNNPTGIEMKGPADSIPLHPYYTIKDFYGFGLFGIFFSVFVFFSPDFFGEVDNYIPADPLSTPAHIVPEWYFLPFYAILRAFTIDLGPLTAKLQGVIGMTLAVAIWAAMPWLDGSKVRSARYRPLTRIFFWIWVIDCLVLGYIGGNPAEEPYSTIGQIATVYYFAHFLVIVPVVSRMETTKPLPESISAAVLK